MSMYCYLVQDDGKGKKIWQKSRTIMIRSTDRGKVWNYLSTVAFDLIPQDSDEIRQVGLPELRHWGFEEPCLPGNDYRCGEERQHQHSGDEAAAE